MCFQWLCLFKNVPVPILQLSDLRKIKCGARSSDHTEVTGLCISTMQVTSGALCFLEPSMDSQLTCHSALCKTDAKGGIFSAWELPSAVGPDRKRHASDNHLF